MIDSFSLRQWNEQSLNPNVCLTESGNTDSRYSTHIPIRPVNQCPYQRQAVRKSLFPRCL